MKKKREVNGKKPEKVQHICAHGRQTKQNMIKTKEWRQLHDEEKKDRKWNTTHKLPNNANERVVNKWERDKEKRQYEQMSLLLLCLSLSFSFLSVVCTHIFGRDYCQSVYYIHHSTGWLAS